MDADNYQLVKNIVDQAFTMANVAVASASTDPIDPNAAWLMKELFDAEGTVAQDMINRRLCYIYL